MSARNKSTIEVLTEHAEVCFNRSAILLNEAARVGEVYGTPGFLAVKKLNDESIYWDDQGHQAVEAIHQIRRR